ncbi:hypothetical protein ACFL3Q_00885 [Planctomycetota bacterium]
MKAYCIILIVVFITITSFGQSKDTYTVEFQINKPYCLLNFMEILRTNGYYGPTLYSFYQKSKFNNDENLKKLLRQYKSLKITHAYHLDGYPKYRFMAKDKSTKDLFYILSSRSESLEDFKQITVGIIPFYEHQQLFEILKAAEPIYDELIWNPYYSAAQKRLKELKEYAQKINLNEKFRPIANFLNSSWSTDIPVVVSFSIVPGEKVRLVPPPQGNTIYCGLLTESDDYSWYIGLITHEFSHKAFAEQPLEMHQQIEQWFEKSKSPHRGMVNFMFNEVLGGAIGHKIKEDLLGHPHEFTYAQPFMRDFDEAIYPLVVSYLNDAKSIDQNFINQSLKIYEETFPNALREYSYLFQAYYLVTDVDDSQARNLPGLIMKNISRPLMYELENPIIDDNNIDALIAYDFTKLLVITKDHEKTIEYLKRKIGELNRFESLDIKSDFILSFNDVQGKPYVIISIHSFEKLEEALKTLKSRKMIDPKNPLVLID